MTQEDKLEQFVRDNSDELNKLEPPLMAWDAIEKTLPGLKHKPLRPLVSFAWKAAAAVLIFASAWLLNDYTHHREMAGSQQSVSELMPGTAVSELSDAEAYYSTQINAKQTELSTYARQHPEIVEDLKKEFLEMDKNKEELKKDLAESNSDEKVIEAIILSYRVKLEILEQMLGELRKTKAGYIKPKSDIRL